MFVVLFFIALLPFFSHAEDLVQYRALSGADNVNSASEALLSIIASPLYPNPGDAVALTISDPIGSLVGSHIVWSVNGKTLAEGDDLTSVSIVAGELGKVSQVTADITRSDGSTTALSRSVIPTEIDLLFDTNTYVPPFYRGKVLPSVGATVIVQAIPRFKDAKGALIPETSLVYTWKRGSVVLGSMSGRGKSLVRLDMPLLGASDTVSVQVATQDGAQVGSASTVIPATDPFLVMYQDAPLFGVMYGSALAQNANIPESETTVTAIPFFAPIPNGDDGNLRYAWQVNSNSVTLDPARPRSITLDASKSSGVAKIMVGLSDISNYLLDTTSTWTLNLLSGGSGAKNDTSTPNDAFHTGAK